MVSFVRATTLFGVFIFLVGCASMQLNYNLSELASTSINLITNQVLANLNNFRQNPFAIPSQVSFPSGSATTTNSITPTVSGPFGLASTTTLANSAAAPLFNAMTRTNVRPNGTVGVTAADQWSQNYSMTPLQDPGQILRLRALYRFGASRTSRRELLCEYPLVQKAAGSGTSSQQPVNVYLGGEPAKNSTPPKKSIQYILVDYDGPIDCSRYELTYTGAPDPALLRLPACVVCDSFADEDNLQVQFQGNAKSNEKTVSEIVITPPVGKPKPPPLREGDAITGDCFPDSTSTIASINYRAKTIVMSKAANKDGQCEIKGSPKHTLYLNPAISNDWLVFGPPPSGEEGGVKWLANYGGQDIYVKNDEMSLRRFSDFVVIILEATQMGGSSSSASSPTQRLQAPAAAAVQIE